MTVIFGGVNEIARALDFHMARQNLLAANIANVDTPGYAPKELSRADRPGQTSFSLSLAVTDADHIAVNNSGGQAGFEVSEEREIVPGNDLNYVSLDREMARLAANSIRFQVVGNMVSKHLGMLRYAAQDAR